MKGLTLLIIATSIFSFQNVFGQANNLDEYAKTQSLKGKAGILILLWNDLIRTDLDTLKSISYELVVEGIKSSDDYASAVGKRSLGSALIRTGQTSEGVRLLDEAGKYFNTTEDFVALTEIYNEIGNGYNLGGHLKKAEKYYLMSLETGKDSQDPTSIFLAKINLAQIYISLGSYDKAIKLLDDYKASALKNGKLESVSNAYSLLGTIEQAKGNLLLAKEYFEKSIRFGLKSGSKSQEAQAYNNLAIVHFYFGNKDSVLFYFDKSLNLRRTTGNMKSIAESYMNLGEAYLEFDNFERSELNYKKGIQTCIEGGLISLEGEMYGAIAELYKEFNKKDLALDYLKKQIEVMDVFYKQQFNNRAEDSEFVGEIRKMEFDKTVKEAYESRNQPPLSKILKYALFGALLAGLIFLVAILLFRKKTSSV